MCSAYIVTPRNAELLRDPKKAAAFEKEVQEWIKPKVARHKYLRGGVVVIDIIPKRFVRSVSHRPYGRSLNLTYCDFSVVQGRSFDAN